MTEGLNPGDKVIALASAATTAAIISGAAAGAIAVWLVKHEVLAAIGGFVGGAVLGGIVGMLVGRLVFPATDGNVTITKWGPSSLPLTMKGNIFASVAVSLLVCGLMAVFGKAEMKTIAAPSIGTSIALGMILALLTSLI
jgi:hypothetical protein